MKKFLIPFIVFLGFLVFVETGIASSGKASISIVKNQKANTFRVNFIASGEEGILVVTVKPIIDGGMFGAKPNFTGEEKVTSLEGVPLLKKVDAQVEEIEIQYPAVVFEKFIENFEGFPRKILGWEVKMYFVNKIFVLPLQGGRNIGQRQKFDFSNIPEGLQMLISSSEEDDFSEIEDVEVIVVPESNSGAFFYVPNETLILDKKFEVDLNKEMKN